MQRASRMSSRTTRNDRSRWHPHDVKNDAEGRLWYYADHFSLVEVNATVYALPRRSTVDAWAEADP